MKKIKNGTLLITLIWSLVSCTKPELADFETIKTIVSCVYKTDNVQYFEGKSFKEKGSNQNIEITVTDSKYIDFDSTYNIEDATSSIALVTYENLRIDKISDDLEIEVNINQKLDSGSRSFNMKYPVILLSNVSNIYKNLDTLMKTLLSNKLEDSKNLFSTEFLKSNLFDSVLNMNRYGIEQCGRTREYYYVGFSLVDVNIDSLVHQLVFVKTILVGDKKHKAEFFFDLESKKIVKIAM